MLYLTLSIDSGDLRNVVRTINQLPEDYTGSIEIVLNDFVPIVVCRNLMILSILGTVADVVSTIMSRVLLSWISNDRRKQRSMPSISGTPFSSLGLTRRVSFHTSASPLLLPTSMDLPSSWLLLPPCTPRSPPIPPKFSLSNSVRL